MLSILITLLECSYIIYMMCFFKTKYSLAHPMSHFNNDIFYHPIGIKKEPKNMICKFGHYMAYIVSIFLIFRELFLKNEHFKIIYLKYHNIIIYISIILCLINFNALLYMLPIIIFERFIKYTNFRKTTV